MTQAALVDLSFVNLRDQLKARADSLDDHDADDNHDLVQTLLRLSSLPEDKHTPDSVDALIQLARNFFYQAQPREAIDAAAVAARLARVLDHKSLLCEARGLEGAALSDVGRFTEATVAHSESWLLTRELGMIEREIFAMGRVGILYSAMAQWDIAMGYFSRARELAVEHGFPKLEAESRNNFANCALQLRDPKTGLRALLPLRADVPTTRRDMMGHANAHDTLAHLYLMSGELHKAKEHARESGRFARLAGAQRTLHLHQALTGLINVRSGALESGLAAVESALDFAKRVVHTDVPDYLSMCVDACEFAGQSDRALLYLHELVAWKQKSIDAQVMQVQHEALAEPARFQTDAHVFDENLLVRAHSLQVGVWQRIQHLVETAINAEVASGYDLYRTFRVAKLSRTLATAIGWNDARSAPLSLGAQLCNIGMMAIPARILQKRRGLSESERQVMCGHAEYGGQLLRKAKVRILETASVIAEQHHERFDGSGYPHGLRGEAIAEEARIVSVCDAFDAMTHGRPWRTTPLSIQAALNQLKEGAGSRFDPLLVNVFVDLIRREFWEHDDFDAFLGEGAGDSEYVRVRARLEALVLEKS